MSTEQIAIARSASIREGLKQADLVEGKDYVMTLRSADGDYAPLPEIIKDLDGSKPRVYVTVAVALSQSTGKYRTGRWSSRPLQSIPSRIAG